MDAGNTGARRAPIWKWLLIVAALLVLLLFVVVLPAGYGYDPTRIGSLLGLTSTQADEAAEPDLDQVIEDVIAAGADLPETAASDPSKPLPLSDPAVSQIEAAAPKTETLRIELGFDGRTEVKVVMDRSKAILYSWKVEGGGVYVDFHGHDPAQGDDFWVRYEEAGQGEEGETARHGSLVAPFAGEHGWYWLNTSQGPITIELTVTGYFDRLVDYGLLEEP